MAGWPGGAKARRIQARQLLARAVAYRAVAASRLWPTAPGRVAAEIDGYRPVVALLGV